MQLSPIGLQEMAGRKQDETLQSSIRWREGPGSSQVRKKRWLQVSRATTAAVVEVVAECRRAKGTRMILLCETALPSLMYCFTLHGILISVSGASFVAYYS
jgi:hypothetical protein